jgi:hypothetical protein
MRIFTVVVAASLYIFIFFTGYMIGRLDASKKAEVSFPPNFVGCMSYIDIEGHESTCVPIPMGSTGFSVYKGIK